MPNLPSFDPWIELRWPVMGDRIKLDHCYRLYAALIGVDPRLKELDWQQGGIAGQQIDRDWIKLGRDSHLMLRCPLSSHSVLEALDGRSIRIGQSIIELGVSEGNAIVPSSNLYSPFVTTKTILVFDPFSFGVSIGKQLQSIGIQTSPILGDRKTIKIKDDIVQGFALRFCALEPEASMILQSFGLGGRRKIGGGVFSAFQIPHDRS